MSVKKCTSAIAEHYVNDLFEFLEIKGENQKLFNEFCSLLIRYPENIIKESWKEIVFNCDLPNGQLAGTMPKLQVVDRILRSKNVNRFEEEHYKHKKEILNQGTFIKLWDIGKQFATGKITEDELNVLVEKMK